MCRGGNLSLALSVSLPRSLPRDLHAERPSSLERLTPPSRDEQERESARAQERERREGGGRRTCSPPSRPCLALMVYGVRVIEKKEEKKVEKKEEKNTQKRKNARGMSQCVKVEDLRESRMYGSGFRRESNKEAEEQDEWGAYEEVPGEDVRPPMMDFGGLWGLR